MATKRRGELGRWWKVAERAYLIPRVCKSPEMVETRFSPPRGALESARVSGSMVSEVSRICGWQAAVSVASSGRSSCSWCLV